MGEWHGRSLHALFDGIHVCLLSEDKHSPVLIIRHIAVGGDGKVGRDISCSAYELSFSSGNSPADGAPRSFATGLGPKCPVPTVSNSNFPCPL